MTNRERSAQAVTMLIMGAMCLLLRAALLAFIIIAVCQRDFERACLVGGAAVLMRFSDAAASGCTAIADKLKAASAEDAEEPETMPEDEE